MKSKRYIALAALAAAVLAGCDSAPQETVVPEATSENCTKEVIEGIKNKAAREEFAGKCLRLSTYKPSPAKSW